MSGEQIGLWAGFIFTLMIFSYVLGDNFLYRVATYVFVGLTAGYITLVTIESVLLPWINGTVLSANAGIGERILGIIPLLLGVLLLTKSSLRLSRLGNVAMAFIIGVGTAVALVGAISGTLIPLARATGSSVTIDVINGFLMFIGVASTLMYFQYLARRTPTGTIKRSLLGQVVSSVGQVFIIITLGAVYAGAILTSLTVFSERIGFILSRVMGG